MDLEKLEKMTNLVLEELRNRVEEGYDTVKVNVFPELEAKFKNLMKVAQASLPEHEQLFGVAHSKINAQYHPLEIRDAISLSYHLLDILKIEKSSEAKTKEMRIFESAEEKMKQVNLAFRKADYTSCFNNLNTALELVLKDKLRIPLTITKINTAKIVDILVKHKVEPYLYLGETKKHITDIANKIKHSGYVPSKSDCIFAIKAMEELIAQLKATEIKLTEEVRNKIYKGL